MKANGADSKGSGFRVQGHRRQPPMLPILPILSHSAALNPGTPVAI